MEVTIHRNYFRVLARNFLLLQPVKWGTFTVGGIYNCEGDKYGRLGQVVCESVNKCHVYELTDNVIMLSEGDELCKEKFKKQGVFDTDMVQYCRFRFLRRYDNAISNMINGELPVIGIEIKHQAEMFKD